MYASSDIYQQIYDQAYGSGVLLKDEALDLIYEKELYSPFDDMQIDKMKKDIEDLKYECFKNFHKPKKLDSLKFILRTTEKELAKIYRKKSQFDHLTCEGVASVGQWQWIIEKSTFYKDTDLPYDWEKVGVPTLMTYYEDNVITAQDFRYIARSDVWRPVWTVGKKTGNLFDRPSSLLTRDQITLCSFSLMYDNVYESQESPPEQVIEDDDCLDGWFIEQKKKHLEYKKEQTANNIVSSNKKISGAGEVFVVAESNEEASYIDSLNSYQAKNIKNERLNLLYSKEKVKDQEFLDVALDLQMQQNQVLFNQLKGK